MEACPRGAIFKREEDGIVVINEDHCRGFRFCQEACPYKEIYYNALEHKSQKCLFCAPRIEQGVATACSRQCPGRVRFLGFLNDEAGPIHKLVHVYKVALPLHPEFGTEPNVYYIPPILPPAFDAEGRFSDEPRVPMDYMRYLFGPGVDAALITLQEEMDRRKEGKASELMDLLIARDWKSLFNIPDVQVYSSGEVAPGKAG
jgi:nitrate reductase beta subunit